MKNLPAPPPRSFTVEEFSVRTKKLQLEMAKFNIGAAFFTTEPEFRYFSGFTSLLWESPSGPCFLAIPDNDKHIAVLP